MSRKPRSKLPPEWQVYSNANRKPVRRHGIAYWKYAVWALLIAVLAGIAFLPDYVVGQL